MPTLPAPSRDVVQVGQYNRFCCDSVLNEGQCLPAHFQSLEARASYPDSLVLFRRASLLHSARPAPRQWWEGTEQNRACLFITWDMINTSKRYFPIDQIRQGLHKQLDLLSALLSSCTEAAKNMCEQVFLYSRHLYFTRT